MKKKSEHLIVSILELERKVTAIFPESNINTERAIQMFFNDIKSREIPDQGEVSHWFHTNDVFDSVAEFFLRDIVVKQISDHDRAALKIADLKRKRAYIDLEIVLAIHEGVILGVDDEIVPKSLCVISVSKELKIKRYSEMINYIFNLMANNDMKHLGIAPRSRTRCPKSSVADFKRLGKDFSILFSTSEAYFDLTYRMYLDNDLVRKVHQDTKMPPPVRMLAEMILVVNANKQENENQDDKTSGRG